MHRTIQLPAAGHVLIYTENLFHILNQIDKKYVLFIHEDQIPVGDIKPYILNKMIDSISKLYQNTSGHPRLYIDNTLEFFNSLRR